jgi:Fur family ferric uptake transcriptional regulator
MQLRMTNQREIILAELKKSGSHLSADELYERVRRIIPRLSLATVYRNLEILSNLHLIAKLEVGGRQKRFDHDISDHDHIYCIVCHRVDNIELNREQVSTVAAEGRQGYTVTGYRLEFAGICPECQKKMNNETNEETNE